MPPNEKTSYSEYKVISISEGILGTVVLGSSGLPIKRVEEELNRHAGGGWQVVFQVIEKKRLFLFWTRETIIITFAR